MRDADIALYRAKAQGKARYAMFNTELRIGVTAEQQRFAGDALVEHSK